MRLLMIGFSALLLCSFQQPSNKQSLVVNIDNITDTKHELFIAVSTESENFPSESNMIKKYVLQPAGKTSLTLNIPDLPYGKYAISIFQDLNGNKKLDTGIFGIPNEPFAFSNNFHPAFKGPKWKDCAFEYNEKNYALTIKGLIRLI